MTKQSKPVEGGAQPERHVTAQAVGAETILAETAQYFGVDAGALRSPDPPQPVAEPRRIAVYLMHELSDSSLQKISEVFGIDEAAVERICEEVVSSLAERGDIYFQTQDLTQRVRNRALTFTYEELTEGLTNLGGRLAALVSRSEPHARALTNDLSSLDKIRMELQGLLSVVDRLLRARELADQVAEASRRLPVRRR